MAEISWTSRWTCEFNSKRSLHFQKVVMGPKRTPCGNVTLNFSYAVYPTVSNIKVLILSKNGRNTSNVTTKSWVQSKTVATFPKITYGPKTDVVCKSYAQFFVRRQSKCSKYASAHSFKKWLKSLIRHDEVVCSIQNGRYISKKFLWAQNEHRVQKLCSILRPPTLQAF